jgi:hypothetical protein
MNAAHILISIRLVQFRINITTHARLTIGRYLRFSDCTLNMNFSNFKFCYMPISSSWICGRCRLNQFLYELNFLYCYIASLSLMTKMLGYKERCPVIYKSSNNFAHPHQDNQRRDSKIETCSFLYNKRPLLFALVDVTKIIHLILD